MSQIGRIMQLNGRSYCARLSPGGGLIVTTCEDGSAQLWDATTQRSVGVPLRHRFAVRWANFSADGRYVATASDDMTAQLWDVASQTPIGMPLRHTSAVLCVEFSPDGRYIATAAAQDARLWELPRAPETLIDVQEMTTLATGVRLNESDRIEPLPWREWRKLRSARSTAR